MNDLNLMFKEDVQPACFVLVLQVYNMVNFKNLCLADLTSILLLVSFNIKVNSPIIKLKAKSIIYVCTNQLKLFSEL